MNLEQLTEGNLAGIKGLDTATGVHAETLARWEELTGQGKEAAKPDNWVEQPSAHGRYSTTERTV